MSPKTGLKPCEDCHQTILVTDPHRVYLWCLERDHNPKSCSECRAMHPKALRGRPGTRLRVGPTLIGEEGLEIGRGVITTCLLLNPQVKSVHAIGLHPRSLRLGRLRASPSSREPERPPPNLEFYEAMRLIFGRADPDTAPSGPRGSAGGPSGSVPAAPATEVTSGSMCGSAPAPVAPLRPSLELGRLSTLLTLVVLTIDVDPILIPDNSESERCQPTAPLASVGLIRPRSDSDPFSYEYESFEEL
ncbi:hypothetical protein NDU88_000197 [Pleurodeles waltl]|uniref:Uncharacterized protein n=1 Tax=Pleurodeles waltl TaxID=8319 RepID=A0AAV7S671_PLEWA|nr:hypothetical protein NDU88_000197 [Pleurodeles waltl]